MLPAAVLRWGPLACCRPHAFSTAACRLHRRLPPVQGHTSTILSALFLPTTGGDQVVCCSADKQVRLLNVAKGAVRPYSLHKGRVRSLVALDSCAWLAGWLGGWLDV